MSGAPPSVTGYLGEAAQAGRSLRFDEVKPALYLCDPVLGDDDRSISPKTPQPPFAILLLPRADIATPNLFGTCMADRDGWRDACGHFQSRQIAGTEGSRSNVRSVDVARPYRHAADHG
ncbi:MAG: hypothetical protein H6883_05435 [Rhodobiaceae bacterium]|nr:hypothetical protein [Rhodobiaceae bacterium]